MTRLHRATPDQWHNLHQHLKLNRVPDHISVTLELAARVEALEAANQSWSKKVSKLAGVAKNVSTKLAAMDELRASAAEVRSDGLAKRIADVFLTKTFTADDPVGACAVIREVAAWLDGRLEIGAAHLLREEANNG